QVVGGDRRHPVLEQKLRHRGALGAREPDDVDALVAQPRDRLGDHPASPTPSAASSAPQTQNRTTVCVSVHPSNSQWWWNGLIRKIRLPVVLKDATWRNTESASQTNSPATLAAARPSSRSVMLTALAIPTTRAMENTAYPQPRSTLRCVPGTPIQEPRCGCIAT